MMVLGCQCGGLVTIPISADATSSHLSHILRNSGLRVLVVDASLAERALNVIRGGNVAVKVLATLGDGLAANVKQNAEAMGIQLLNIRDVENKGAENPAAQVTPGKEYIYGWYTWISNGIGNRGYHYGQYLLHVCRLRKKIPLLAQRMID